MCALSLGPSQGEVVLSLDEKAAIVARSRRCPGWSAGPGSPARQEFEYRRHGTASLVAAPDVRTGEVLAEVIHRNNAVTFTAFLDQLDRTIAPGTAIHVVLDNRSSHTARCTKNWLARTLAGTSAGPRHTLPASTRSNCSSPLDPGLPPKLGSRR